MIWTIISCLSSYSIEMPACTVHRKYLAGKHWRIWRIISYPPKFSSPIAFTCTVCQNFPRQIFPMYSMCVNWTMGNRTVHHDCVGDTYCLMYHLIIISNWAQLLPIIIVTENILALIHHYDNPEYKITHGYRISRTTYWQKLCLAVYSKTLLAGF